MLPTTTNSVSLNTTIVDFCVSGASISRCPWITWVDCFIELFNPKSVTDYSCKGAGNQYIVRSAFNSLQLPNPSKFLAVMFTNFDKYDMWVVKDLCEKLKDEKHIPRWIDGSPAVDQGFWCTGSHFPLIKEIYRDNFFNLELAGAQDLTQILGLIKYCEVSNVPLVIMFDSPIFDYTESQINDWSKLQKIPQSTHISQSPVISPLLKILDPYIVDTGGLIGFCIENNLPWYNKEYGAHPPSISHYLYFQQRIIPWVKLNYPNILLNKLDTEFESMIDKMTEKWEKNKF